jgi:hypothetical protein
MAERYFRLYAGLLHASATTFVPAIAGA